MIRGQVRAARGSALAIVLGASLAALAGCQQPTVGEPVQSGQTTGTPQIEITGATISAATGQVKVSLTVKSSGVPISKDQLVALRPTFSLAALSPHPVDGAGCGTGTSPCIKSWRSLLLIGSQKATQLPAAGPGTPAAAIFPNVKQPGGEYAGTLAEVGAGEFTYTFATLLNTVAGMPDSFVPTETHRLGAWLALAVGDANATATYDFVPAGGADPAPRDAVVDAQCNKCHGAAITAHGGHRMGVKVCLTCHTWQLADPDTVDPAALDGAATSTDPNPLDLGRMVHRIHRGKNLPTLYQRSSLAASSPSTPPPYAAVPPAPFLPGSAANPGLVGRKYAIVGYQGHEYVFGRIAAKTDNFQPARTVAEGVSFPRELRDCEVCHAGAPQAYEVLYAISRRTCSGCHPDVWFQNAAVTDAVHFPHTGGPQPDDAQCKGCHLAPIPGVQDKVWVRIGDAHVALRNSPSWNRPSVEIVSVSNLKPGAAPTIVFKLKDRAGTILTPSAPSPASETSGPAPSPIPRAFPGGTAPGLRITLTGPTAPDYDMPQIQSSTLASGALVNPDLCAQTAADSTPTSPTYGQITYTFTETLPANATGTWAVLFEGRRSKAVPFYDVATQTFRWPFTGETVYESPDNAIAYVDTATGAWTAADAGAAAPRRTVVSEERCLACHGRFELHGFQRHQVEGCLVCHSPQRTDWVRRPKLANGTVNLAGTFDGLEERSVHFKVLVHRIHTGGATGAASLEAIEPHVVYGYGGTPYWFDELIFPAGLGNCTKCHAGTTYRVDSVPADAPPTVANENPTIRHTGTPPTATHAAGEPSTPPVQAACLGCHANGFTLAHAASHTVSGVEQCAQCHVRGTTSVDIVHGLAKPASTIVSASFSSIVQEILVPRCASAACHGGSPPAAFPRLDAEGAYDAIVGVSSQQVSGLKLVDPFAPDASYLLLKMRGEAASVGGIATPMPIGDAMLDPSDLAAVEAWILNGAPND